MRVEEKSMRVRPVLAICFSSHARNFSTRISTATASVRSVSSNQFSLCWILCSNLLDRGEHPPMHYLPFASNSETPFSSLPQRWHLDANPRSSQRISTTSDNLLSAGLRFKDRQQSRLYEQSPVPFVLLATGMVFASPTYVDMKFTLLKSR